LRAEGIYIDTLIMFLFFQGIIELISDLDYLFNATQNEKITD